jgi:hypothetical protein
MINHDQIQIDEYVIPLKNMGCIHDSRKIIDEWESLESKKEDGFPLTHLVSLFSIIEKMQSSNLGIDYSPLPLPIHIIRMIDTIMCCQSIEGASNRINKLKQNLCSLVSEAIKIPSKQGHIALEIFKIIFSINDEFQIGCLLHNIYPSLKFNRGGGPDFILEDNIIVKVEAKSKLNRTYLGDFNNPSYNLDKLVYLILLSRDAYKAGTLRTAFDKQETNIALINLYHSEFGDLFAASVYGSNNETDYQLQVAFNQAISLVKRKKRAVILYSEMVSNDKPYRLCAITADKDTVDMYGSQLELKEKETNISERIPNYYNLIIEEAKKMASENIT